MLAKFVCWDVKKKIHLDGINLVMLKVLRARTETEIVQMFAHSSLRRSVFDRKA